MSEHVITNAQTGEVIARPFTQEEQAERAEHAAKRQAASDREKAAKKREVMDALGLNDGQLAKLIALSNKP